MNLIGQPAPLFDAPSFQTEKGHFEISLESLKKRWVLLFFYPLDFTPTCNLELNELEALYPEFLNKNCEVLSVSVDSTYSHQAWIKNSLKKISFPMVSDIKKRLCRDYGTLDTENGISFRGAVLVDPEGLVQFQLYHNLSTKRNVKEILNTLNEMTKK